MSKLTVQQRLDALLDPGSFQETDPGPPPRGEGVVTGMGRVDARPVAVYAQDFAFQGGSLGEVHAGKIARLMDRALQERVPIIGLNDSGGARIQEGVVSLGGYGEVFLRNVRASGVVPQVAAILGPCAGGAVYSPALADFVFVVEGVSRMFITGPDVIRAALGREVSFEEVGGAALHARRSGNAHFLEPTEQAAFLAIRRLVGYLPSSSAQAPPRRADWSEHRREFDWGRLVPDGPERVYDVKPVIAAIVDPGEFFEVHAGWAGNAVVGFARLAGEPVGIVADQPLVKAGTLDVNASDKVARFVRFCDAFNLPVITFVDIPGFLPGLDQEEAGVIRHGAKVVYAYAEATVPRLTIIMRKAYGGAYVALGSRHLGAAVVFAWPGAEIAVMGIPAAINVLHRKELAASDDPTALHERLVKEYRARHADPRVAVERGYVDALIRPEETRARVIQALAGMERAAPSASGRRHANIPL